MNHCTNLRSVSGKKMFHFFEKISIFTALLLLTSLFFCSTSSAQDRWNSAEDSAASSEDWVGNSYSFENRTDETFNGLRTLPEHRNTFFQSVTGNAFILSPGSGAEALGIAHGAVSAMFAAPCPGNHGSFLISPTFCIDSLYEMPASLPMRSDLYRAGVTFTWMKDVNDFWRVLLFITPGYASDFKTNSSKAIRIPGGGMAIWTPTPQWQFQLGAMYTALDDWPIIPFLGAVWQPNENWKVDLLIPKPRICRRFELGSNGVFPVWVYVAGEYWGGSWAVEIQNRDDLVSYRDLRLVLGVERDRPAIGDLDFSAEIGLSFCRKLYFEDRPETYRSEPGFVGKIQLKF